MLEGIEKVYSILKKQAKILKSEYFYKWNDLRIACNEEDKQFFESRDCISSGGPQAQYYNDVSGDLDISNDISATNL